MDGVAFLIKYMKMGEDEIGQPIKTKCREEILVSEKSLTRSEFYSAGRQGLSAEKVLTTAGVNYSGESEIEYEGKLYTIYRTFNDNENSDDIELYLTRKASDVRNQSIT